MASTFTTRNKLEKQGFAENDDTWGVPRLNAVFDRIDESMDGFVVVDAGVAPTGTIVIPIRADLIPVYGSTIPSRAFTIDTAPSALSVHRRGIRVANNAPVRGLILPVVEKVWFVIVDEPAIGGYAYQPTDFVYIANGVDPVMVLSPGVWCVFSTAAGALRATNMATVRVDNIKIDVAAQCVLRPEYDRQHYVATVGGGAVPPLIEGTILTEAASNFLYYPGWSMTYSNVSGVPIPLTDVVDTLRGLNWMGPVAGLTIIPAYRSVRILWTGSGWNVL